MKNLESKRNTLDDNLCLCIRYEWEMKLGDELFWRFFASYDEDNILLIKSNFEDKWKI